MLYTMDSTGVMHDADGNEVSPSRVLTDRQQQAIARLQALHGGCRVAIDDYGRRLGETLGDLREVTMEAGGDLRTLRLLGDGYKLA